MNFTFEWYRRMIKLLSGCGYQFVDYHNWMEAERPAIMRHDVDCDLEKAAAMAEMEAGYGIKSTYFILVSSDFYNVSSKGNRGRMRRIQNCGHEIGLHFDEGCYPPQFAGNMGKAKELIIEEAEILSRVIGSPVTAVSMHRPSKAVLGADLDIPGMVNSYSQTFFREFKYLSDSRRCWREPVEEIISSRQYKKLHILTHAFWYFDKEKGIHDTVSEFVNGANHKHYQTLKENFTGLESVMDEGDVIGWG